MFWRDDMYLFRIIVLFFNHHLPNQFMEHSKEIRDFSTQINCITMSVISSSNLIILFYIWMALISQLTEYLIWNTCFSLCISIFTLNVKSNYLFIWHFKIKIKKYLPVSFDQCVKYIKWNQTRTNDSRFEEILVLQKLRLWR